MLTLILIGLVGGLITGISPCVLPVLPVIFLSGGVQAARPAAAAPQQVSTRQGRRATRTPGRDSRRPYLVVAGLALSFSVFTLLGTLVLSALPVPQSIIRWAGLVALVLLGIAMMFPRVQEILERPFTRLGQRQVRGHHGGFVLGLALGAVYVPCAGPVLAAITVAGASGAIGLRTVALTVAFAIGAAVPLLVFALAGRRVAERVRAFRDRQRGIRIAAGVVVIALAVALTFNVTDALQRTIPDYTSHLNQALDGTGAAEALGPVQPEALQRCSEDPLDTLQDCGPAGAVAGIAGWLNTAGGAAPSAASLTGKVTLIDFWAYSCINCQRAIPHVESWYRTYAPSGLQVIGVHTPEYAFERDAGNVAAGAQRLHITYPVALDNDYTTWNAFKNSSWPAEYLVDATGRIRHVAIGEGAYGTTESLIRQLLTTADPEAKLPAGTDVADTTPDNPDQTPESYLGAARANNNVNSSVGRLASGTQSYTVPDQVPLDTFALGGTWTVADESITAGADASIELAFDASEVYLDVGGTGTVTATVDGRTTTIPVSGAPDIHTVASRAAFGTGTVTLTLSPGLTAYSFTFG